MLRVDRSEVALAGSEHDGYDVHAHLVYQPRGQHLATDVASSGLDDAVTRERRTLRARYQLVENSTGQTVLDATAGSDAGIDVVSSDYATIAAENSALERLTGVVADQIVSRVALYAKRTDQNPAMTDK